MSRGFERVRLGGANRRSRAPLLLVLVLALAAVAAAAVGGVATFRTGDPPSISIESDKTAIGRATTISVQVAEPKRGLVRVEVDFVQGDRTKALLSRDYVPQRAWATWEAKTDRDVLTATVGKDSIADLVSGEGSVRVRVSGAGTWLFESEPVTQSLTLPIRLTPPTIELVSAQTYVAQGGCEAVVYRAGDTAVKHGVRAGDWWFPGYPLPGQAGLNFAVFAVPYDLADDSRVRLAAIDDVGNESSIAFLDGFAAKPFKTETIEVSDRFMSAVVPSIIAQTPGFQDRGSLLDNYVAINSQVRRENDKRLFDLASRSKPEFLWDSPFLQMNAQVFASFADRRTYVYQGKEVDQQFHLGFDLASTQRAPVPAANDGIVVLAEFLGIYGNAIVLDHGYGLMTLYGHLSSIEVGVDARVERGQTIGHTGATGLALGDHLHFSVILHGLPVRPLEWWDARWIEHRIAEKLKGSFSFKRE